MREGEDWSCLGGRAGGVVRRWDTLPPADPAPLGSQAAWVLAHGWHGVLE